MNTLSIKTIKRTESAKLSSWIDLPLWLTFILQNVFIEEDNRMVLNFLSPLPFGLVRCPYMNSGIGERAQSAPMDESIRIRKCLQTTCPGLALPRPTVQPICQNSRINLSCLMVQESFKKTIKKSTQNADAL